MKIMRITCCAALCILLCAAWNPGRAGGLLFAATEPGAAGAAADKGAGADRGADSGISTETDAEEDEAGESQNRGDGAVEAQEKKEFVSVRKKRSSFTFKMGFGIGGIGYGILGPHQARKDQYQFKYSERSFMAGFRGGIEALFFLQKRHCLSIGAFYEQRRVQIKIGDVYLSRLFFPGLPPEQVYYLPLSRYIDKSNVDTNYVTLPVGYRFHVLDEFYIGFCLDVAVLFQAKANYAVISFTRSVNCMRYLQSVDFGGRALVGFTMNRAYIEVGIGGGFLDIDRLPGERHTIYVNGMVGYRI